MIKTLNKKIDNKNLLLLVLAFFTIAVGLWGNYRQLWLADNGLSAASIAKVISISSVVAALSLIFFTQKFTINKLKKGMLVTIIIKIFIFLFLLIIDKHNQLFLIKFLSFFDIACENIIITSVYPYIMCYQKSDKLYGKKSVVENLGKTIGVLIGSIIFGRIIAGYELGYKTCILISMIFCILAFLTLLIIKDKQNSKITENKLNIFKYLKDNTILIFYLIFNILTNISYNLVVGLKMLMLTTFNNFSTQSATYLVLFLAIIDIVLGYLSIEKLKSKNDYLNISIKFLIRIFIYLLVLVSNSKLVLLLSISYTLITNVAYGSIINGFITNSVKEKQVLDFTVLNYISTLFGEAIGIFIAGLLYAKGYKYILLVAAFIVIIQLGMAYRIIYKKNKQIF